MSNVDEAKMKKNMKIGIILILIGILITIIPQSYLNEGAYRGLAFSLVSFFIFFGFYLVVPYLRWTSSKDRPWNKFKK